jgi:hypothetical protein
LGSYPVDQLFGTKQLVEIHDLKTGCRKFADSRRAFDNGYAASILWGDHFVQEWGIARIVGDA